MTRIVDDIAAHRDEPLLIAGMNNQQFALIQALRARGVPDGGLHPDTLVLSGGGNKGRALPDDYQQQFAAFYQGVRRVRSYGMTELQGSCLACEKGNYHVPPWVIPLVLDRGGREAAEPRTRRRGRAVRLPGRLPGRPLGRTDQRRPGLRGLLTLRLRQIGPGRPAGHPALRRPRRRRQDHLRGDTRLLCEGNDPLMSGTTLQGEPSVRTEVVHVVRGEVDQAPPVGHGRGESAFTTPALDLDRLVWPRTEPGPAFDVPLRGDHRRAGGDRRAPRGATRTGCSPRRSTACARTSPLPRERAGALVRRRWAAASTRRSMEFQVDHELGGADVLDGWREVAAARAAASHRTRAFPPRLIHVIAGNAPGVAAMSVVRGALTKGVHLLKLPSNDLFTATAILRTMAAVAPDHPVVRSFSAAYWRGGDDAGREPAVPPAVLRQAGRLGRREHDPQRQAVHRPGLRAGRLRSEDLDLADRPRGLRVRRRRWPTSAERAAADATIMNQQACASSRVQFVEGSDAGGRPLLRAAAASAWASSARPQLGRGNPLPGELRDEIDGLRDTGSRTTGCGAATTAGAS